MVNKKLAKKILAMVKRDQRARKAYTKSPSVENEKKVQEVDKANLKEMKKIVRKFGWPSKSLVGKKVSNMAWLLAQHADSDVAFQEHCLKLAKEAEKIGEVSKTNIAYLIDRVLVNQGRAQIYGTQFYKDRDGRLRPREIEDINNLEKRRKKMELETFNNYRKKLERRWGNGIFQERKGN